MRLGGPYGQGINHIPKNHYTSEGLQAWVKGLGCRVDVFKRQFCMLVMVAQALKIPEATTLGIHSHATATPSVPHP